MTTSASLHLDDIGDGTLGPPDHVNAGKDGERWGDAGWVGVVDLSGPPLPLQGRPALCCTE